MVGKRSSLLFATSVFGGSFFVIASENGSLWNSLGVSAVLSVISYKVWSLLFELVLRYKREQIVFFDDKEIELKYQPRIEEQSKEVCGDLPAISSDEKDKFIRNLLHAYNKSLK